MGTVFLAEQIAVGNRPVALKVLNRRFLDDPQFLLRFREEAASTGRIRHPNVVTLYDSGQADDGTPYIALEYLEGESLRQALRRDGAFPLPDCAEILTQLARGLNAAHKLGIIHRDLKPDNIFLARDDENELIVKVLDFGIAKLRESTIHTKTGFAPGTAQYMSYEQAYGMRSDELDARSDVYSLGVILYEMLTGSAPFQSPTSEGFVRMHLQEAPPPFRIFAPGLSVPAEVEAVVMKALTKNRDKRYPTALEFARDFARAASAPKQEEAFGFAPTVLAPAVRVETPEHDRAEQERVAREKVEAERRKQERVAAEQAGREKAAAEQAARKKSEQERLAREKAEAERPEKERVGAGVGAVREPPLHDPGAHPQPKKRSNVGIASLMVAVVGVIVVALSWVYWPGPTNPPSPQPGAPATGTVKDNPRDGLKYVWIPPGTFMMGCSPGDNQCFDNEKPAHQVKITIDFWIGQTAVTAGAYKRFARATERQMPGAPDFNAGWANENMPIVDVTWNDAQAYCAWMGGRLPTEAEWEYAARGGSTEARYGNLDEIAWYDQNSGKQMHEVAQKRANGFGLYDMLGNVWEWVRDWFDQNYYQNSPAQDPTGPASGQFRVLRGGSWGNNPRNVRVSNRVRNNPGDWNNGIGFRCGAGVFAP